MSTLVVGEKPATTPLKLLWINPVTTSAYNEPFANMIKSVKLPNAEVHIASLNLPGINLTNLEWRAFEAAIFNPVVHIARYAGANGYDGYCIPCFYDTALDEAREMSSEAIVSAPCEASLKAITGLCNRFSVIIGVDKWKTQMEDRIRHYGYGHRLVSFTNIGLHVEEFQKDKGVTEARISKAVQKAKDDGAEGVILGCTIEFGFYQVLQKEFGIPVIDAAFACYKDMENMAMNKVQFGWKPSRVGSMEPPSERLIVDSGIYAGPVPMGEVIIVPRE
jgi:allantoin racemase